MKEAHRFKAQKKHAGEATKTKPVFDFEGRRALAWRASLELFTTAEHLLGTVTVELSLCGAVEQSR